MSEKDEANLLAMLDSAGKIIRFSEEFEDADALYGDEKTFDAVLMNFVVIGETVSKLSLGITESNPHVEWGKIKGLRNLIAHHYTGVDAEEIWEIIQRYIPVFIKDLTAILSVK